MAPTPYTQRKRKAPASAKEQETKKMKSMIARALNKHVDHKLYSFQSQSNMLQGNVYITNLTSGISQGDTSATRDGRDMFIKGIKVNIRLNTVQNHCSFRFRIFRDARQLSLAVANPDVVPSSFDTFAGFYTDQDAMVIHNDPFTTTCLRDDYKNLTPGYAVSSEFYAEHYTYYVPINRRVRFQPNSYLAKGDNLYMTVTAFTEGASGALTQVGGFRAQVGVYYTE